MDAPAAERLGRHYYVDEAGDPVLFGRRRTVVLGREGCSRYFTLGVLDVADPSRLASQLAGLRKRLLCDPYFADVPSMQPQAGKTALAFHAKDDLPEVRREVFRLLLRSEVRFFACVRDKRRVLEYVREREAHDAQYRYTPNELYERPSGSPPHCPRSVHACRPRTTSCGPCSGCMRGVRIASSGCSGRPSDW